MKKSGSFESNGLIVLIATYTVLNNGNLELTKIYVSMYIQEIVNNIEAAFSAGLIFLVVTANK